MYVSFTITDFDRAILLNNNIAPNIAGVVINTEPQQRDTNEFRKTTII